MLSSGCTLSHLSRACATQTLQGSFEAGQCHGNSCGSHPGIENKFDHSCPHVCHDPAGAEHVRSLRIGCLPHACCNCSCHTCNCHFYSCTLSCLCRCSATIAEVRLAQGSQFQVSRLSVKQLSLAYSPVRFQLSLPCPLVPLNMPSLLFVPCDFVAISHVTHAEKSRIHGVTTVQVQYKWGLFSVSSPECRKLSSEAFISLIHPGLLPIELS